MEDLLAGQPEESSALQLAQALTDFARAAGGHDNITVVVIDLSAPEAAPDAAPEKGAL
jgi:serine/threonine protein phosphatase PrpC